MSSRVITANRLSDGRAVWMAGPGDWTIRIAGAAVLGDEAAVEAALAAGAADAAAQRVLDVYAVEVDAGPAGIRPKSLRERIRAEGPTTPFDFPDQVRPAPRA